MTTKNIGVNDSLQGETLYLQIKAFLRGAFIENDPTVVLVVKSEQGKVLAAVDISPSKAHELSEIIRQEAELASIAQEEQ
jgi:hypothetical protein